MTRGVISTRKTTRHSSRFAVNTTEVRKHEGLAELPSLGLVGSFELLGFQRGVPTDVGYADELISTNNEDFSGLQLESSPNAPPENRRIDPVLQNVEIPLEVRNTALKSKEIRALGLLLTTLRTLISKSVLRNIFLVLSSYYKLYSLFRACAVAYGLGFLFSKADQVANLANLLVTTLASLFLDSAKHNMYARLVSDLRLPNTVEQSLSGFMRRDKENLDSYTHSTVLENLKRSMVMVVRDYLDPQNVGDAIDQALVPSEPAAIQLIDFSTETISMDKFKADHPFIFLPHHVETPVHVFTSELRKPGTTYYKLLRSLQSIALPIFLGQSTSHWDSVVSHQIRPIMVEMGVKVQDLAISMMKARVHKLPNLLEWVNRDVDYRALVATDWVPLIGALSNWEAKDEMYSSHGLNWRDAARMKQMYLFFLQQAARISFLQRGIEQPVIRPGKSSCMSQFVARLQSTGSPRLKAMLDRVNLPYSFLTWELVNLCFIKGKDCSRLPLYFTSLKGTKLTLSVSEVAVPLEFELREPPNPQTAKILQSFPKTVRPMRSPFGYAGKGRPLSLQPAGLFARIRRGLVTRTKELLSPFLTLITLARQAWGRLIQRLKKAHGPKISMRIKPAKDAPEFLTITLEATGRVVQLVGRPLHMLQRIDPFQCEAGKEMKSNGESFQLTTAGGMQGTINFLREWHHTKKLLRSAYPEARDLEIQQDISEWHNPSRRNLEKMLRLNGVDGRPFKESWTVILNCSETAENVRWEVLDLDVPNQEQMVVKEYVQDFGELATLASAVEKELSLVAGVDHVLKRMQETFFDHAYKRMLYIESPGAFLQQLIDSDSQQIAREFEHWLLQRLQGNSRSKRCRPASFYGKAYAQYVALLAYYEKKDLTAPVPDLEEVKRFLLTASVPKGHLVRIPREEDSQHSGIYRMVERLDRCTFLLEDANRSQLATDASLHIVRRFEDGDQISHQYVLRRQYKLIEKDATTGVCKVRDRHGYQFDLHSEETTPITIGQFAYQSSKLSKGTWVLSDSKAAYNTVIELKINYLTEFEVEQSIVQDCYTGIACIIRDDRDLPIMVHYAIPELATSAWTGPWLWLFLNGLHAEYLSIISSQLFVRRSRETNASVPNRCFASLENFEAFFPGASSGSELAPTNSAQLSFFQQTEQIVSKTAYAAYLLRKEREESAISGVKQHFRNRTCGPLCAAWWLKANELKSMVRRFSEAGQPPLTPQHEQFILAKALSTTPLGEYWTSRICTFQKSFRKLFTLLRLPYEQEATVPCSKMSAIIILATIMSDITLLIRRRAVTTGKQRVKNMEELLRFLKDNHVPVPCTYELPDAADLLNPTVPPDSEECMRRDIAANAFMRMKSLIDAAHVQVDDVIQEIRKRFTATLYSRLSPRFVSTSSEEYRHQAAEFRDVDEEVDDLFAALYHSNIQDQSGFRQERTILLFTGLFLIQISARGTSFSNSVIQFVLEDGKAEESLKETAWPLLGLLLRQTVLVQSDPAATYELQCDALKNLRWGLKKLGLGSGEKTIQQVVQLFLEDANFAEVASFLPPPVEGFDTHAVPVGFLRFQSGQTPYSVLVTPSGDALFGSISERVERSGAQKRGSRSLVSVRVSEGILYVEDAVSEEIYRFDEPTGELTPERAELS
ncbi:uncharacterized protein EMH_0023580 [Eimeria mitis]|uniref:Uncharacterized protein n=1 Tax=Eimeria mitis TaxID=44415 RepID=U6K028_9EIME|nr:uncharacterized protein EMH_0023580 [Eimeria mitis]CDJ29672.1 hypothetical protein EMH_0023580 [Eimeria mitis]